jgi:hypothetical protein
LLEPILTSQQAESAAQTGVFRKRSFLQEVMKNPADLLVQLGQVGTLVIGSLGIWIAMLNQRRQLNAQMYIEISRRFQELLRLFPTEAWLANRNPNQPLPPPSREITDCTLYCIQLISEVYHLHVGGYISTKLWLDWEREIRHTLEGPIFQREWEGFGAEFAHDHEFVQYIDTLMRLTANRQRPIEGPCDPSAGGFLPGSRGAV